MLYSNLSFLFSVLFLTVCFALDSYSDGNIDLATLEDAKVRCSIMILSLFAANCEWIFFSSLDIWLSCSVDYLSFQKKSNPGRKPASLPGRAEYVKSSEDFPFISSLVIKSLVQFYFDNAD